MSASISQEGATTRPHPSKVFTVSAVVDLAEPKPAERPGPGGAFDAFCDDTSISGFRFLHSRNPSWFRCVSALVLFGSIGMFLYHSSIYVRRFRDKRDSIQMFTTKVPNLTVPYIVICPMRQMRSIANYDGPADFMHLVSNFYLVPNQIPLYNGVAVDKSAKRALAVVRDLALFVVRFFPDANQGSRQVLRAAEAFTQEPTFRALFPKCTQLLSLERVRTMAQDSAEVYRNYSNLREWVTQTREPCFGIFNKTDPQMRSGGSLLQLMRCRISRVIDELEQVLHWMRKFPAYVRATKPPIDEFILFCRWLDGGPCTMEYVPSELGIDCAKLGGQNHLKASYATLRNNIDIMVDVNAFDNKLSTWEEHDLRILLYADNVSSVCTTVDGFI